MSDIKMKAIHELQLEEELGECSTDLLKNLVMLKFHRLTVWLGLAGAQALLQQDAQHRVQVALETSREEIPLPLWATCVSAQLPAQHTSAA